MQTSASSRRLSRRAACVCNLAGVGLAAALTLAVPGTASSAGVVSDWVSAVSGAWNVDANWINTPAMGGFPNNGNGGVPTYDALIDVTGAAYTVTLSTNITVEDLALNSVNATVNHTSGTFTATGAITISAGTYQLNGGTISTTNINLAGGNFVFTANGGILSSGAIFNGDLNLSANSANVRLQSGADFTGVANVSGSNALLAYEDTRTLTGKTINLDGLGARLNIEGTNTLTLGTGTLVRGGGITGGQVFVGGTNGLTNQAGTIRADLAGQTLTIGGSSFNNQAGSVTEAINGSVLAIGATNWSNAGQISAVGGSTVTFNNTWSNTGGTATVDATSTLNLNGSSTIASLGTINNSAGGTVNIGGTINNTGTNLAFNATTGSWRLLGGTISGGQITPGAGGQTLLFTASGGSLSNGALFNGDLNLSANSAAVRLQSGADFTGVANVSGSNALLAYEDTRTLTGKTINLDGLGARLNIEGTNTLTLGTGTLVRGGGITGGQVFVGGTNGLTNQAGTIRADLAGQTLTIGGSSFSNQAAGVAEAINGSTLTISATNWSNAGQISAVGGSTVNFNNTWSNTGGTATVDATSTLNLNGSSTIASLGTINNSAGGTVNIGGTINNTGTNLLFNATTGSWRLFGGTISGGQITPGAGGQTLLFTANGGILSNGAIFNGDLNLSANSANVRLQSGADFTGVANVSGSNALLAYEDTRTLTGKTINLDGLGARLNIEGTNTLTLGTGTLVRGGGITGGQVFVGGTNGLTNQAGTIRADLAGQTLTIGGSSFNNQAGSVAEAINGSTLTISATNWSNAGQIRAVGGSTVTFNNTWSNTGGTATVDATSTLNLNGSSTIASLGTINNSAGGTVNIGGTINNTGTNLLFNATTGSWRLFGGTISGGQITPGAGGQTLLFTANGGSLSNGAIFNGDLNLSANSANVRLQSGADFTGVANVSGSNALLAYEDTRTLTGKTINLDGLGARLNIEGTNTLTLGTGTLVRGQGITGGQVFVGGTNGLTNQAGTIRADLAAQTLTIGGSSFSNQAAGVVEAINGSTLSITATTVTQYTGTSLTGGIWRVFAGSVISLPATGAGVVTNQADITLSGVGSVFRAGAASGTLDNQLTTNAGALRILAGRNYTAPSAFTNSGVLQLGGGIFTAPGLTVTGTGELFGFGTVAVRPANSGAIRSNGGTLVLADGIGTSGTAQIDPGSVLDLSAGSSGSSAAFLIHNGTTAGSLNLGTNTFSVDSDYTNASFGVGNAFDARANVAGSGQIVASGNVNQTLGGAVTNGGTPTATLNLGNIHVGGAVTTNYLINNAGTTGPALRGAIQTTVNGGNVTDARLGGAGATAGNFGPIAAGANSGNLAVTFTGTTAGALSGQAIHIANNFDDIPEQNIQLSGAAFRFAQPSAHTPEPVVFANRHVGDAAQQAIAMTNTAANDGFSEELDAEFGAPVGNATASGSFGQLAPQATNNTSLRVGIDTSTAGAKSGTVPLNLASNGSGTSDLARTVLPSQTVNVSGNVYRLASATAHTPEPVDVGVVHIGEVAQRTLTIANAAANDGFSEKLSGSISGATGQASGSGSFTRLNPGTTDSTSLLVGIDTSSAGTKSGTVILGLTSDGLATSDLPTTTLTAQTVNVQGQVNNFASAIYLLLSGNGTLTQNSATSFTLDFGVIGRNTTMQSANLGLNNNAAAPADSLAGTFTFAAPEFTLAGFNSFSGINAGQTLGSLSVGLATENVGDFNGQITLAGRSRNVSGFDGSLGNTTLNVHGQVIPEPATALLATIGGAGVLLIGRKRSWIETQ